MARNFKVTVNGTEYSVNVEEVGASTPMATNVAKPVEEVIQAVAPQVEAAPAPTPTAAPEAAAAAAPTNDGESTEIKAPMPGKVLKILVDQGEMVKEGQVLLLLEAMKMENEIFASGAGVVKRINCKEGETVNTGDTLLVLL